MILNSIQTTAFELIQSDARFIYTIADIMNNSNNVNSNFLLMSQPYIGLFANGAEQWSKKLKLNAPVFNKAEQKYYIELRQAHKLFIKSYDDYSTLLIEKLTESDKYFYQIRSPFEKIFGYNNVGVDLCNGEFCGNTILCATYNPMPLLGDSNICSAIKSMSIIVGKIAAFFSSTNYQPIRYDNINNTLEYKDYHFYKKCPLKIKTNLGFVLFSILCSINYATVFVDKFFIDEIPQKFKFAYLQYYYLCDFIKELNEHNGTAFHINNSLKNREFRNCLAHYGLGQFLDEIDIDKSDVLKGLTNKTFNMDYYNTKKLLYNSLSDLCEQIKNMILI